MVVGARALIVLSKLLSASDSEPIAHRKTTVHPHKQFSLRFPPVSKYYSSRSDFRLAKKDFSDLSANPGSWDRVYYLNEFMTEKSPGWDTHVDVKAHDYITSRGGVVLYGMRQDYIDLHQVVRSGDASPLIGDRVHSLLGATITDSIVWCVNNYGLNWPEDAPEPPDGI